MSVHETFDFLHLNIKHKNKTLITSSDAWRSEFFIKQICCSEKVAAGWKVLLTCHIWALLFYGSQGLMAQKQMFHKSSQVRRSITAISFLITTKAIPKSFWQHKQSSPEVSWFMKNFFRVQSSGKLFCFKLRTFISKTFLWEELPWYLHVTNWTESTFQLQSFFNLSRFSIQFENVKTF